MLIEGIIIEIYVRINDFLKECIPLRKRGFPPKLSDAEVITMDLFRNLQNQNFGKETRSTEAERT
jgi:hypothetical protein